MAECTLLLVLQLITTPFWPAYLTPERIKKAPKLKLAVTAGIGRGSLIPPMRQPAVLIHLLQWSLRPSHKCS